MQKRAVSSLLETARFIGIYIFVTISVLSALKVMFKTPK
jgi:hypothetical protein